MFFVHDPRKNLANIIPFEGSGQHLRIVHGVVGKFLAVHAHALGTCHGSITSILHHTIYNEIIDSLS